MAASTVYKDDAQMMAHCPAFVASIVLEVLQAAAAVEAEAATCLARSDELVRAECLKCWAENKPSRDHAFHFCFCHLEKDTQLTRTDRKEYV